MPKEEVPKIKSKRILTLFLILFPSLVIAGNYGSFATNLIIKLSMVFYQFVVVKNVLDDYYSYIE